MTAAGSKFRSTSVRFGMEFIKFCCKFWFMFCGEFIMFCGEFIKLCGEFIMFDAEFKIFCWCWGEFELFELLVPFCMSFRDGTDGGPPGVIGLWTPFGVCGVWGVWGIWWIKSVNQRIFKFIDGNFTWSFSDFSMAFKGSNELTESFRCTNGLLPPFVLLLMKSPFRPVGSLMGLP